MLGPILLASALVVTNPVSLAIENYKDVASYATTIHTRSVDGEDVMRYYYKRPGLVRMEFVRPHKGAVLVYDPGEREVRLRPFGFIRPLVLKLKPESWLVRSRAGHTVDRSDIGALLENAANLMENGSAETSGKEMVGTEEAIVVDVKGREGHTVYGIAGYTLWLDRDTYMPLRVKSFNAEGDEVEEVVFEGLELNPEFKENFFSID